MTNLQGKPYSDVVDEWLSWNKNTNKPMSLGEYAKFMDTRENSPGARESAYNPDLVQKGYDAAQRFLQDPKSLTEGALSVLDPTQSLRALAQPALNRAPQPEAPLSAYTGEMGAQAGKAVGNVVSSVANANLPQPLMEFDAEGMPTQPVNYNLPPPNPQAFEQVGRAVGTGLPQAAETAPLLAAGWPGLVAAAGISGAEAYTPHQDVAAGLIAPLATVAGARLVPAGAAVGENAALRGLFPTAESLASKSSGDLGATGVDMLRQSIDPAAAATVQVGRLAGGLGAGTLVGEAQRQATNVAHGEGLSVPTLPELATNLASNAAFAVPLAKSMADPYASMQVHALDVMTRAQQLRNAPTAERVASQERLGSNIADAHAEIFKKVSANEDPTEAVGNLKSHWIDVEAHNLAAATPEQGLGELKAMEEDANTQGISDDLFHRVVAGVQGKFEDQFKDDTSRTPYGTIEELVNRGLMPKLSKDWISQNFADAQEQTLGDYEGAKTNLINRITAYYEEALPGALQAMRAQPVPEGLSKQKLDAQTEADKDAAYIGAILKLYPHMKDAKVDGKPLANLLYQKDADFSNATQGGQLNAESAAWARYDAWKDAILRMADTYDPVTRTGTYFPSRRLSDGTMLELPGQKVSLEQMVGKDFTVTPTKKNRSGTSNTALRDAVEFVNDKFGSDSEPDMQDEEAMKQSVDPSDIEGTIAVDRKIQGHNQRAPGPVDEQVYQQAADDAGVEDKDRAEYIQSLKNADQSVLGTDSGKESNYDVGLYLMNHIDKLSNYELWDKYGGKAVFGKGALSPGKMSLFKDALMAKMESEMDDTGQLSAAQVRFYNAWKKNASGEDAPVLAKTWEEQRAQFRHALRLYWRNTEGDMPGMFMAMLKDKPKYQALLQKDKTSAALPALQSSQDAAAVYNTYRGLREPLTDTLRLFRGYGRKLGLNDSYSEQFATVAAKMVQAFDETAGVGKLKNTQDSLGLNISSQSLGGPVVGLNLDRIQTNEAGAMQAAVRALQILGHELTHNYSDNNLTFRADSAYRAPRIDAYAKLRAMFNDLGPVATGDLVNNVIPQVMYPPNMQTLGKTSLLGQDFGQEAISRLMEHVMLGAFTKNSPWQSVPKGESWGDAVRWLPNEVQSFTHFAFRDLSNYLGAIKQYFRAQKTPGGNKIVSYIDPLLKYSQEFLDTELPALKLAETSAKNMLARMTAAGSVDWDDPTIVRTSEILDTKFIRELAGENISYAIPTSPSSQANLAGPMDGKIVFEDQKRLGQRVPTWSHWMSLAYQTMLRFHKQGNPLAEQVMYKVNDLEKAYFRLNRNMHDPFLVYDKKGRLTYDKQHPLLELVQKSGKESVAARKSLSQLALWQNEYGKPISDPGLQQLVQNELKNYSPKTQQGILEGLKALVQGHKNAADLIYHDKVEDTGVRLGGILMAVNKEMFQDQAFNSGKAVVSTGIMVVQAQRAQKAAQEELQKLQKQPQLDPMTVQQAQQAVMQTQQQTQAALNVHNQTMQGLEPAQIGAAQSFLFGKAENQSSLAESLVDLQDFFTKRGDWFTTETRPGRIFIISKTADGTPHYDSANTEREAKKKQAELVKQGNNSFRFVDRNAKEDQDLYDAPDAIVDDFVKLEDAAWKTVRDQLETRLSPDDLAFVDSLGYTPGEASHKFVENRAIARYMRPRKLTAGRENLDAVDAFVDYTGRLSGSIARRALRREITLVMADPRLRGEGEFKNVVAQNIEALMQPLSTNLQVVKTALTARYLGLPQLVSPLIEMMQSGSGVMPYFVQEQGFVQGIKTYTNALVRPAQLGGKDLKSRRLLADAQRQEAIDPSKMTKEQSLELYYKRQADEGGFNYGPIYSATHSRDHQILTQHAFGLGASKERSLAQLISDPIYWAAQKSMILYSHASGFNSRVAFLGALEMNYDKGLRGTQLFQAAAAYQNLFTHGGGKANSIGYVSQLSNPATRSFWALTEVLQRYTFGSTTMLKDAADQMVGRMKVSKEDRIHATEALLTSTFVQFLLAGAMGITGMGIGAAVIQKLTGFDAKQKLREFWVDLAERMGADEPLAVTLANYAQNGAVSNALGVDVSNRMTNNSILGFNNYDGFNASGLFGVGGSAVEDLINATKFAAQSNFVEAGKSLLPPSARPYLDLAQSKMDYGNYALRDKAENMQVPLTGKEAVQYALGLRPQRYRFLKDQLQANMNANNAYNQVQGQKYEDLAKDLSSGNVQSTLDLVKQMRAANPLIPPTSAVRSIIDKAVAANRPLDPLAVGPIGTEQERARIGRSFGDAAPRQSELQDAIAREKMNAATGYQGGQPQSSREYERAVLIDAIVKSKGVPRSEAVRLAKLMGY